jgi:hypothetical protein
MGTQKHHAFIESRVAHAGHGNQQFSFERRKHTASLSGFRGAKKSDVQVNGL